MPIANCLICENSVEAAEDIVSLWSSESGISAEHMTVNFTKGVQQSGRKYKIMCSLYLPTAWGRKSIDALQLGLSRALTKACQIDASDIHIITLSVQPGMVVEAGVSQTW